MNVKKENKRLIPLISVLLISGFLLTSLASYFVSRASLRSEISLKELPLTSDNIYSEIQRDLLRPVFISSVMANDTFLRDWVIAGEHGEDKIVRYLNEMQVKYNTFTSFFVSDISQNYYYPKGILKKVNPQEERDVWYYRVKEMKDDYEINVDIDLANKDAMTIFINYKVFDYDGKYIGATGVGLTVDAVIKRVEIYQMKYNRTIYFIDKNGDVKLAGTAFNTEIKNISQMKSYPQFKNGSHLKSEASFSCTVDGQVVHTNVRYIEEFDWYLVVEQSEKETIKHISTTLEVNLVICVIITIIVVFLVNMTLTAYQKRIETLCGIVPICSFCKQIRDDKGYWNKVESYVSRHTDAQFSHSICPVCMEKEYPEEADTNNEEADANNEEADTIDSER